MRTIPVRVVQTILDEIESVYDDVTKRAYEKFLDRRGACVIDIEEWLEAEQELLLKPPVHLIEKSNHFIVRVELEGVDPRNLKILLTTDDAILQSITAYPNRRVFRTVHFRHPIDTNHFRACWVRESLVVLCLKKLTNGSEMGRSKKPLEYCTLSVNEVI